MNKHAPIDAPISVIIPTYNSAAYLADAIESVISQSHPNLQIIVVDDGSTDDTIRVMERYQTVSYVKQKNSGASAARNAGLSQATGELLAFLDADDLWCPGKLAKQVACLENNSALDMVFGLVDEFHTPNVLQSPSSLRLKFPGYVPGTLLIRRASFARVGNFSGSIRTGEFIDWLLRAKEAGLNGRMVEEVLLLRRLHANNSSRIENCDRSDYARVLKASLDRRRAKTAIG